MTCGERGLLYYCAYNKGIEVIARVGDDQLAEMNVTT